MRIWVPVSLIFLGLIALITMGVIQGGIPEVPVRTLLASPAEYSETKIKLQGVIKKIHRNSRPLEFEICDRENEELVVRAFVDATCPTVFDEGKDVAVEGIFDSVTGQIRGQKIYTKCPSKYEASEEMKGSDPDPGS